MCPGVGLPGFSLIRALSASYTWISVSFSDLGKFSAIISSNKFSTPFTLLMGLIMQMFGWLILSQSSLNLSSFPFFLSYFCSAWVLPITAFQGADLVFGTLQSAADSHSCICHFFIVLVAFFISDWFVLDFLSLCRGCHWVSPLFSQVWWASS